MLRVTFFILYFFASQLTHAAEKAEQGGVYAGDVAVAGVLLDLPTSLRRLLRLTWS